MLHDPEMEVTCDGNNCNESVFLPMNWSVGGYDLSDSAVQRLLESDHNWTTDGDEHYCDACSIE